MSTLSKMWPEGSISLGSAVASIAVLFSLVYLLRRQAKEKNRIVPPKGTSFEEQAIPLENNEEVFKCGYLEGDSSTLTNLFPEVKTLYDVFLRGLQISENGDCVGERKEMNGEFVFSTYGEVYKLARDFGSFLSGLLGCPASSKVGIYSRNCPGWLIAALGCVSQSAVVVPLYDTLGIDAANFIVRQTEISVIVVDDAKKARQLLKEKSSLPTLRHVVVIESESVDSKLRGEVDKAGLVVHSMAECVQKGQGRPATPVPPLPDDTYIICYTSGTTGNPKGVILTHANLVANLSAFSYSLERFMHGSMTSEDVLISYLPLSHMMEQMDHWATLVHGASIGYFRGDIKGLPEDIQVLKPTILPVVPRLLNRLYDSIQAKVGSSGVFTRTLYNVAYMAKEAEFKRGIIRKDSIWDKLVFSKIQAQMGGRVRLLATGSAPISAVVLQTCRIALGAVILEAYGQTECTALATATWPGEWEAGHVGGPCSCATIKLADVPELSYYAKDRKGEVLIKGPSVTKGYFKDEEKTAELFDEEGFLRTGDIGWLRPNGTLQIIDRKKHIFKLAQGEYVAPEKIENTYARCGVVQQVYVDGSSLERWLIAVIVPEPEVLKAWDQSENGQSGRSLKEICKDKQAEAFVLNQLTTVGRENKLNSIEQVKAVVLEADPFTVENGLLTPTLKAKRPLLRAKYNPEFMAIYSPNSNL